MTHGTGEEVEMSPDSASEGADAEGVLAEQAPAEGREEGEGSRRLLRWVLPALGILMVLGIVAAVLVLVSQDSGSDTERDSFGRADRESTIGRAPGGPQWTAVSGTWGIEDHQAYVSESVSALPNLLVASGAAANGTVTTKLSTVAEGAGLVFRFRGADDYWELAAFPKVLSWQIYRVQQGRRVFVGNTGAYSKVTDGTSIGVRMDGRRLSVLVDGKVKQRLVLPDTGANTRAGLAATGEDAGDARWSDYTYEPR